MTGPIPREFLDDLDPDIAATDAATPRHPARARPAVQPCVRAAAERLRRFGAGGPAGDTHVDVQAARHAGVLSIGVCSGKLDAADFDGQPADHVLPSIAQVLDLPEFAADAEAAQRRAS